jgi:hypothetical protein
MILEASAPPLNSTRFPIGVWLSIISPPVRPPRAGGGDSGACISLNADRSPGASPCNFVVKDVAFVVRHWTGATLG